MSAGIFGVSSDAFLTDIDDSKLQRHFALIGRIPLLWSEIEFGMMMVLAAFDQGDEASKVRMAIVLHKIGNRDRADLLAEFVKQQSLGLQGDACAALAAKAYGILNTNRNTLLHAHAVEVDQWGRAAWTRFSSGKVGKTVHNIISRQQLTEQVKAMVRLRLCLLQLYGAIWSRRNPDCSPQPWPRRFGLPKSLQANEPRRETPANRQPRASRQRPQRDQQ